MSGLKLCPDCWARHKKEGWYMEGYIQVQDKKECDVHPHLDNWRLQRTLRTLKWWSCEQEGYTHSHCSIRPLRQENGWLHYRVVKAILFDYEVPFIEYLIGDGAIEQHACERKMMDTIPSRIRLTPLADKLLLGWGIHIFQLNGKIIYEKDGKVVESAPMQKVAEVA